MEIYNYIFGGRHNRLAETATQSLHLTWSHLDSLGLTLSQWVSHGLTWTQLLELGLTWTRSNSIGLTLTRSPHYTTLSLITMTPRVERAPTKPIHPPEQQNRVPRFRKKSKIGPERNSSHFSGSQIPEKKIKNARIKQFTLLGFPDSGRSQKTAPPKIVHTSRVPRFWKNAKKKRETKGLHFSFSQIPDNIKK